jgi:hypothetical protein
MSRFITYTNTLALFGLNVMLCYEQSKSTKHWDNCLSHCTNHCPWQVNKKTVVTPESKPHATYNAQHTTSLKNIPDNNTNDQNLQVDSPMSDDEAIDLDIDDMYIDEETRQEHALSPLPPTEDTNVISKPAVPIVPLPQLTVALAALDPVKLAPAPQQALAALAPPNLATKPSPAPTVKPRRLNLKAPANPVMLKVTTASRASSPKPAASSALAINLLPMPNLSLSFNEANTLLGGEQQPAASQLASTPIDKSTPAETGSEVKTQQSSSNGRRGNVNSIKKPGKSNTPEYVLA